MQSKKNERLANPYNDDKVIAACSLFGCLDITGRNFSGEGVVQAIANMHNRGNGLGGGFAVYGLYPEHKDHYAFHIMYQSRDVKAETDVFLEEHFDIIEDEEMPTKHHHPITNPPLLWRYFLLPRTEPEFHDNHVVDKVLEINKESKGAYVFSSGKNMGVFKGVGYPEDIARFFKLDDYKGYLWTAHGRFPTNTPGWWGGAHPFNLLDWTVVHNGEISSYGINRRYLEAHGYPCTLQTDTEVMAYAVDLLMRKHRLPVETACKIFAPPFWSQIDQMGPEEQNMYRTIRQVYPSLLMNGPFTVIIARHGEMLGLTDRIRLRPLTAATRGNLLYLSSEEAAIRLISPDLDRVWTPNGGEPIIGRVGAQARAQPAEGPFTEVRRK
ncbi:MAG: glutamine amidotransferase family protein [Thaumarchaeota archaeon]|nr:glutamine amidotransferase family protein [Nitrososphaerota archaeon]